MNFHQLKIFTTIVETGSLTRASELLYITQPAISIQLKQLETSLGVHLFERSGKKIIITDIGIELYKSVSIFIEHEQKIVRQINSMKKGLKGTLSLGSTNTGMLYLLCEILCKFRIRYSDFDILLYVENAPRLYERLFEGIIDVAFEWFPIRVKDVTTVPLCSIEFPVLISPLHPKYNMEYFDIDTFLNLDYITVDPGITQSYAEAVLREKGLLPKRIMRLPTIDAVKKAVETGVGVTILSKISVQREIEHGYLRTIILKNFQLFRNAMLIKRKTQETRFIVNEFIGFSKRYCQTKYLDNK